MFRIKICGVTRPEDARLAVGAGADANGLNFYERSPRFLSDEAASAVAAATPAGIAKVGVFVNATAEVIKDKAQRFALDYIQLHGDEPPAFLAQLAGLKLIRAFRLGPASLPQLLAYLDQVHTLGVKLEAILVDALSTEGYGGTGKTIDWAIIHQLRPQVGTLPIILAGGLNSENVAQAIQAARPDAVDTASGVESAAGLKDGEKVSAFILAARTAFSAS